MPEIGRIIELVLGVVGGGALVALINAFATRGKVAAESGKIEADALESRIQSAAGSVIKVLQDDNARLRADIQMIAGKLREGQETSLRTTNDLAMAELRIQRLSTEVGEMREALAVASISEAEDKAEIQRLRKENESQEREIDRLRSRVAELETKLRGRS